MTLTSYETERQRLARELGKFEESDPATERDWPANLRLIDFELMLVYIDVDFDFDFVNSLQASLQTDHSQRYVVGITIASSPDS